MLVGILGGTFDPPHVGHLDLCHKVMGSGLVDRILVVPCLRHAFGKSPVSFQHRVAMCELMVGQDLDMVVSEEEALVANPGRTLELVNSLIERNPGVAFRLVAGSDIYHEREQWYAFDEVARLAQPIYVSRRGIPPIPEPTLDPPIEVSSSQVREALLRGELPRDLLPRGVAEYIIANKLYGVRQ